MHGCAAQLLLGRRRAGLLDCLLAWAGHARKRALTRRLVVRFAGRREAKAVAPAFRSWEEAAKGAKRRDVVLARFGEKLRGSARAKCFNAWCADVAEIRRHRVTLKRCRAKMTQRGMAVALVTINRYGSCFRTSQVC